MLNKYMLLLSATGLLWFSDPVNSFNPALESSQEEIATVRQAIVSKGSFPVDHDAIRGKVIVSVKDPKDWIQTSESVPPEYDIPGSIPRGIITFLQRYKPRYLTPIQATKDSIRGTEFIFTGYGNGGKIALVLSALWAKEYEKVNSEKPNQIKTITFSSSCFGNKEFNSSVCTLLGKLNILDFSTCFARSATWGVPIYILPGEQFVDTLKSMSYRKLIYTGGVVATYYLWHRFTSASLDKIDLMQNSFLMSLSHLYSMSSEEKVLTYVDSIKKNLESSDNTINAKAKALVLSFPMWFLVYKAYDLYKNHQSIPSEKLLLTAFQYAKDNYHSSEDAPLNHIGKPPLLLSGRRGFGGWLMRTVFGD